MKHKIGFNRLGRKSSHRKALIRNMVSSLFIYERIKTTKSKAKEIRKAAEKMITKAKIDSVHTRREIAKKLYKKSIISKLFTEIAPRFETRPGGYTRIIKLGKRPGDSSDMVFLELVERKEKKKPEKKESKAKDKTETKTEDKLKTEKKTTEKKVKTEKKTEDKAETVKKTSVKKEKAETTAKNETEDQEVKNKPVDKKPEKKEKDMTVMNDESEP